MQKERIVLFGAGHVGRFCERMFRYDKEIVCFVDNDSKKWGDKEVAVYPPEKLKDIRFDRIVIAMFDYAGAVLQLEEMGIHNYVYFEDVYSWQLKCRSREIMDMHIPEHSKGQYTGRFVKNACMNHLRNRYEDECYKQYIPNEGRVLDVGSGCGTSLFYWLLMGYDAHGIDCCDWKLEFCRQKIEDFHFPSSWKECFHFGYGESLPFEDSSFDLVTSWYVLEHVANVEKCIEEMIRVLKPGGTIFINAPDYRNSYEEHYGIDIGKPIVQNQELLKSALISGHDSLEVFDGLNFIIKPEVIAYIERVSRYGRLEIIDLEKNNPGVVREDGLLKYRRRIQLIVKKY